MTIIEKTDRVNCLALAWPVGLVPQFPVRIRPGQNLKSQPGSVA